MSAAASTTATCRVQIPEFVRAGRLWILRPSDKGEDMKPVPVLSNHVQGIGADGACSSPESSGVRFAISYTDNTMAYKFTLS